MIHETKDDAFLENIILFLVIVVGVILTFNQFQYLQLSSNIFMSAISFLLILTLVVLVTLAFTQKKSIEIHHSQESAGKHSAHEYREIKHESKPWTLMEKLGYGMVAFVGVLILFNQFQISQVSAFVGGTASSSSFVSSVSSKLLGSSSGGNLKLGKYEFGSKITLKPMPLAPGEQPVISGYKTKVKPIPTISELTVKPSTGDTAKDLLNNVIPTGTPWYGQQAGVTFDDPIAAQKKWAAFRALKLNEQENQRWSKIVNSFTCDYCCGSPQNPTIITRCGCAHSAAAQGMAKWFVRNYADKYSDEEIYGEMGRWYALWYPGPTIKRIVQELQTQA